jgi:hypothetical protein
LLPIIGDWKCDGKWFFLNPSRQVRYCRGQARDSIGGAGQAEVGAAKAMLDRTAEQFEVAPCSARRLAIIMHAMLRDGTEFVST